MNRSVDEYSVPPLGAQPVNSFLATMSGAVIHNPKDATSGLVGFLAHDFTDQAIGRGNSVLDGTTSKELGTMHIPGGKVGPRTLTKLLVLHAHRPVGSRGQSWLFPAPGLNTRLFIEGNDEVISAQGDTFPNAFIEVKDGACSSRKVWIARENPASMVPRTKSVLAEPAPQGGSTDLGDQPLSDHMMSNLGDRQLG